MTAVTNRLTWATVGFQNILWFTAIFSNFLQNCWEHTSGPVVFPDPRILVPRCFSFFFEAKDEARRSSLDRKSVGKRRCFASQGLFLGNKKRTANNISAGTSSRNSNGEQFEQFDLANKTIGLDRCCWHPFGGWQIFSSGHLILSYATQHPRVEQKMSAMPLSVPFVHNAHQISTEKH